MFCEFEHLYFSDEGYVVHCINCNHYQIAFGTTLLTLNEEDFLSMQKTLANKVSLIDYSLPGINKTIVIETPVPGMCVLLSSKEATQLHVMLDEADNEIKTRMLLKMFN